MIWNIPLLLAYFWNELPAQCRKPTMRYFLGHGMSSQKLDKEMTGCMKRTSSDQLSHGTDRALESLNRVVRVFVTFIGPPCGLCWLVCPTLVNGKQRNSDRDI